MSTKSSDGGKGILQNIDTAWIQAVWTMSLKNIMMWRRTGTRPFRIGGQYVNTMCREVTAETASALEEPVQPYVRDTTLGT